MSVQRARGSFVFGGNVAALSFSALFGELGSILRRAGKPGWRSAVLAAIFTIVAPYVRTASASVTPDATVSTNQNSPSATITSPAFSTNYKGELLLAFVAADNVTSPNTTVTGVSGAGLTWTLVVRTNVRAGTSEIWRAWAPSTLSNATASATLSQSVTASITVMSFRGVSATGTNGSGAIGATGSNSGEKGAPLAALRSTRAGSLLVGVGNDFDNAIARVPFAGQQIVNQALTSTKDTYWVQRENTTIPSAGIVATLGDNAPLTDEFNLSICEVLPPASQPQATLSTSSLNFGSITDGSTEELPLTISSTGGAPLQISAAGITGAGLSLVAASWPQTIAAGSALTLEVRFAPTSPGAVTGQLTLNTNSAGGSPSTVALAGTGLTATDPQVSLSATSLNFGTVTDGSAATQSLTLTSTGTSAVTVSSDGIIGTGFSVSGGLPATLSPKQSLALNVQFMPTTAGSATGTLTVNSNSVSGSKATVALSGTGAAVAYSVDLNWSAPSSTGDTVAGYHIYRALSGGSYALLNSGLDLQTSYVDSTVAAGSTYAYVVKSVDNSGVESVASNTITVPIP